jgi:hypothetical protein
MDFFNECVRLANFKFSVIVGCGFTVDLWFTRLFASQAIAEFTELRFVYLLCQNTLTYSILCLTGDLILGYLVLSQYSPYF